MMKWNFNTSICSQRSHWNTILTMYVFHTMCCNISLEKYICATMYTACCLMIWERANIWKAETKCWFSCVRVWDLSQKQQNLLHQLNKMQIISGKRYGVTFMEKHVRLGHRKKQMQQHNKKRKILIAASAGSLHSYLYPLFCFIIKNGDIY